jgi:hypothetical protein
MEGPQMEAGSDRSYPMREVNRQIGIGSQQLAGYVNQAKLRREDAEPLRTKVGDELVY